jgi:hypothetical protein
LQALAQQTPLTQCPRVQSPGLVQPAPVFNLNAALTVAAAVIVTLQADPFTDVKSGPLTDVHAVKTPFAPGDATSCTLVP